MFRRFSTNFAILSMGIDMLIVAGSLYLASTIRPAINGVLIFKSLPESMGLPLALYGLFPIITLLIFASFSLYDGKKFLRVVDEFSTLTLAFAILSISLAGILYLSFRDVSRALFLLVVVFAYVGFLLWRSLARLIFRLRKDRLEESTRRVLVVGAGPLGQKVQAQMLAQGVRNLQISGFVDDEAFDMAEGMILLGKTAQVREIVRQHDLTDVVIALPYSAYRQLTELVSQLEDAPVHIWVALGFFDLVLYKMEVSDLAGIPMLDLRAPALSEYQLLVKRAFDLVVGSISLVVVSPLMLLSALLVWLQDRGPIIFKQSRAGENGRLFTVYKFRSMLPGAEQMQAPLEQMDENGDNLHKRRDDPRVTRVGRFLRRTSLDELPQLFNVLEGSMSLVGPRPELPELVAQYQPWQRKRFTVPPGITGWWQVNGRSDKPLHLNTEEDLYYISNYSIWLDILILIRTVWEVLIGRGSY